MNQRNTIGALTASPSSGLTAGQSITFTYILHTAGASAPTSETVQFYDGASALGSGQTIGSVSATNPAARSYEMIAAYGGDSAFSCTTSRRLP